MGTSSDQPTSYTSVNIGDPKSPLSNWITEQLQGIHTISNDHVSIYRVPRYLRQVNEEAFTPQMVSIGPFHHGKAELQPWEENKMRYLQAFLDRSGKSLEDCTEFIKRLEGRARACYRDKIDMTSNAFVKMMLVDSCFIIESIWRWGNKYPEPADYLSNPELIRLVFRDMLLLENQIPFFVLRELFHLGFNNPGEDQDEFLELSFTYFATILPTITEPGDMESVFRNVKRHLGSGLEVKHFTDLFRICHLPEKLQEPSADTNLVRIPNAARLSEAGMKFEIGTSKYLHDINYNNGFLEMPMFQVHDDSECLLKNLIALETCHYPFDSYIINYICFMDMLIDSATDVDLLMQKGIIINDMSSSAAVASLFNNLAMETTLFGPYYFTSISDDMNAYYEVPWHNWKATFKRDYCRTPWMIASTMAAIILLVLTLVQTICSIISLITGKS